MALPTTITGYDTTASRLHKVITRPFISSGGNVYLFGRGSSGTVLRAFKATDPTSSFSNVGTDVSVSLLQMVQGFQVGDVVHIITADASATTSVDYLYHTFNMATDAWVITGESIAAAVSTDASGLDTLFVAIGVRSDGDVITLRHGASDRIMGSDYVRVVYDRRESATWTNGVAVDPAGEVNYYPVELLMGASDRAHLFFSNTTAFRHISLSSTNGLGSVTLNALNSISSTDTAKGQLGTTYVSGANTKIPIAVPDNTANDVTNWIPTSEENPTFSTNNDITGTTSALVDAYVHSLAADGTTLWHTFVDSTGNDIYTQSNDDEAGWSTPELFYSATANGTKTSVYERSGSTVLAMLINDNGTLLYHEKVLSAAGPVGNSNVTLAALTNTGDGSVTVTGDQSATLGAVTNTTDASVSLSGDSAVTLDAATNTTDASVAVQGDSAVTLADLTQVANGTVADPPITGDSSVTLDAVTNTGDGSVAVDGTSAVTLDAVTNTGDGSVTVTGDSASTLADVTPTADASVSLSGDSSVTLDSVSPTTDASVLVQGDSSVTLATITQDANGTVGTPPITGNSDVTLGALTPTADASVAISGDSSVTLDGLTPSATAITFKTRLYLTRDAHTLQGSLPIGPQATAPLLADYNVVSATSLRSMSVDIHSSTSSLTGTSDAVTDQQVGFYGMWTSNPLTGNQTITDQSININAAFQQSSTAMNLGAGFTAEVYVWRPSTGAKVGTIHHNIEYADDAENAGAAELRVDHGTSTTSTEVAALDGDVIVCELYQIHTQDDAVARSGTIQIGGNEVNINTNALVTFHASFIEFENAYVFDLDTIIANQFNVDLDDVTATADGTVTTSANSAVTLDDITHTADASVAITGNSNVTLDAVTPSATAVTFKTRLYLHTPANSLSGTFPTDSQATAPLIYDYTMADATTLRTMDTTKGTESPFTVKTGNSLASASQQDGFCGFFTSPPLDGNQTITDAGLNINAAFYQSNVAMNFGNGFTSEIYVWRPSTGAKVGTIHHNVSYTGVAEPTAAFSEQVNHGSSTTSTSVAALDGDVIIAEFHQLHTQDDAVSYQGAFYFDGNGIDIDTNDAANSHASFIEFEPLYAFQEVISTGDSNVTLDDVTNTGDGSVIVTGDSSVTLDAVTPSADGSVDISGDSSTTLDPISPSADGSVLITGDSSVTLDDLTLDASGIIGPFILGDSSITLDDLTQTATGSVTDPLPQRGGDDAPPRRKKVPASDKPNPDKVLERRMEETLEELVNPRPAEPPSEESPAVGATASELASALLPLYTLPKQRVYRPGRKRLPPPLSDEQMIILLLMVM